MADSGNDLGRSRARRLVLAGLFGLAFGFLLQKGGVAKFHVLIGVLLLEDFTVVKVMGSAILVGMMGVFILHAAGKAEFHLQPLRLGSQVVGGLVFGVGFGLLAYCPGTGAAALGQGNWDAAFGMAGLIAGSYIYAMVSAPLSRSLGQWGARGKLTLPDVVPAPRWLVVLVAALVLAAALAGIERLGGR